MKLSELSRSVMTDFPIRKSKQQKEQFRDWLCRTLSGLGYEPGVEESGKLVKNRNVVVGDPEQAEVLLSAHYDTCAVLPIPNLITPRNPVMLVLYQLLMVVGMIALCVIPEIILLVLWHDAPMGLSMAVVYAMMIFCIWWMLAGKANKHCVNDNTSGVLTLLEILQVLPEQDRNKVCVVFFDNEEKGLLGSAAFAKQHKNIRKTILNLNFDCVSDGDYLHLFPGKALKKEDDTLERLRAAFRGRGEKTVTVCTGFGFYPSDQRNFLRGVGICALNKKPLVGYYMDKIHTGRDRVMEEENLLLFRDGVLAFLADSKTEKETTE